MPVWLDAATPRDLIQRLWRPFGGERIRRGYFRIWVLVAGCWALYFGVAFWPAEELEAATALCRVHATHDVLTDTPFSYSSCGNFAGQAEDIAKAMSTDAVKIDPFSIEWQIGEAERRRTRAFWAPIVAYLIGWIATPLLMYPAGMLAIALLRLIYGTAMWVKRGFD